MWPLPFAGVSEGFEWRREEPTVGAISLPQTIAASALKAKSPIILLHFLLFVASSRSPPSVEVEYIVPLIELPPYFCLFLFIFISLKAYYIILGSIASVSEQGQKGHL